MRPVLKQNRISRKLWILYLPIFLICIIGIGVALYFSGFQDENLGAVIGITSKDSEEEEQYNELKLEFNTLFTNQLEILQEGEINTQKLTNMYNELVVSAYNYQKSEENMTINVCIPQININDEIVFKFNKEIRDEYNERAKTLMKQVSTINTVYSVGYRAYIQNNILSLAIRSEFKEGTKSQKVSIKTINYNFAEKREVTAQEILNSKNINSEQATKRIRNEIKSTQEQNQPLIDEGYQFYIRDYNSDKYEALNIKQFLYGKDGMLYIIYAYGNEEDTSEMDVIIFK